MCLRSHFRQVPWFHRYTPRNWSRSSEDQGHPGLQRTWKNWSLSKVVSPTSEDSFWISQAPFSRLMKKGVDSIKALAMVLLIKHFLTRLPLTLLLPLTRHQSQPSFESKPISCSRLEPALAHLNSCASTSGEEQGFYFTNLWLGDKKDQPPDCAET